MIERIESLRKTFTELTGFSQRVSYLSQCQAREWLAMGFTEDDLRIVVARIKKIETERIRSSMLRWSFLIGNPVRFEEELQEARAVKRNHKPAPSDKAKVMGVTGRTEEREREPKLASQVMSEAGQKAFEEFKALRGRL
jgi:hypothetical protein